MKVLLLGAGGQLGRELTLALEADKRVGLLVPDRAKVDLMDPTTVRDAIRVSGADVVISAAAYTAVDRAESEPELARAVNAVAPGVIAETCKQTGARLIHYSTDYVLDGTKRAPYVETDPVAPLNVYGQTKLEGDETIRLSGARHVILRVGWVYSPFGKNFFLNMLRRAREGAALRIVNDQIGVPTSADAIAAVTAQVLHAPDLVGLFHYAPSGQCSWFEFAQHIMRTAGVRASVDPITTAEYPTPARRPEYSVLDSERLRAALPIADESWEEQLGRNVARLSASVQA